jgi:hypothetical protein
MKHLHLSTVLAIVTLLFSTSLWAQAPQSMNYQGIARQTNGKALSNTAMQLRISIIDGKNADSLLYTEEHQITTNAFGLYNLQIGNGRPVNGLFEKIIWASGNKYIQVSTLENTAWVDLGTTQLLSVPYALYAETSGKSLSQEFTKPNRAGTLNYLSKFDATGSSNAEVNSLVFDNGTSVGINTNSPQAKLHINQNALASNILLMEHKDSIGYGRFAFYNDAGFANRASFTRYGSKTPGGYPGMTTQFPNANLLAFGCNVGSFLISTNGKIGMSVISGGTSKLKFFVDSNLKVGIGGNAHPTANTHFNNTDGNVDTLRITNNFSGHGNLDGLIIGNQGNNAFLVNQEIANLNLGTSNIVRATINSQGFVGINTTTPTTNLEVNGTVKISGGSPGAGKVLMSDSSGLASWQNISGSADNWGVQTVQTNATLNGNGTTGNTLRIAQQGAIAGQVLKWNGTTWLPSNDSVGLGGSGADNWGTQTASTSSRITGNGTISSPLDIAQNGATNGKVLKWNGIAWTPSNDSIGADNWGTQTVNSNATLSGNGTAGNTLRIAQQGATTGQVLKWNGTTWLPNNDSIGADNWGTQTVNSNATLSGNGTAGNSLRIAQQGATTGQVLKWNGTTWAPSNDSVGLGGSGADNWGTQSAITSLRISGNGTTASPLDIAQNGATTGQVLKWNGSSWAPAVDTFSANSVWKTNGNAGTNAATNFIGTTDNQNIIFKRNNTKAGQIATTNTALGVNALANISMGTNNTAFGVNALSNTDTGSNNVAMGYNALVVNKTGNHNIGIGANALALNNIGNNNIALGNLALNANKNGTDNIAIGTQANQLQTTGYGNVAIGAFTGNGNKSGSFNTFIGGGALPLDTSLTNATAIGYDARVGISNALILGDSVNAKVGIGTAYPTKKLDVRGQIRIVDGTQGNAKVLTSDAQGNASWQNAITDNWGTQKVETDSTLGGNGTIANPLKLAKQGATIGQSLKWNGTTWLPANIETDSTLNGAGTIANPFKIAKQGASNGQVLKYNGITWLPANDSIGADNWGTQKAETDSTLGGNGTVANPLKLAKQGATIGQTLKWNGTTWLPASIETDSTLNGVGTIANPFKIAKQGATVGQVLKWNGTTWLPANEDTTNHTSLNEAYNYGGPGGGSNIIANAGAVTISGFDGLMVKGKADSGMVLPPVGSGPRMFFYPKKAAFRAGNNFTVYWDHDSIGYGSTAFGGSNKAIGDYSFASNATTTARGARSFASGYFTQANGTSSTSMGSITVTDGIGSFAVGIGSKALDNAAIALGDNSIANFDASVAIGENNTADAINAIAIGRDNQANQSNAIAIGYSNIADSTYAMALGYNTLSKGFNSLTLGEATVALGRNTLAAGEGSYAAHQNSVAMGYNSLANNFASMALGDNTIASGASAMATGYFTTASGESSFTFGNGNSANGIASIAGGNASLALGYNAVAIGETNIAKGTLSTAFGNNIIANGASAFAVGRYNDTVVTTQITPTSNTPLFSVGNGTSNIARHNALVVLNSGNIGINTNAPNSTLQNNGSLSLPARLSGTTTLTDADHTVILNANGAVLTFPTASTCPGRIYVVVSYFACTTASNYVNFTGAFANTLSAGTSYTFQSINNQWQRIN